MAVKRDAVQIKAGAEKMQLLFCLVCFQVGASEERVALQKNPHGEETRPEQRLKNQKQAGRINDGAKREQNKKVRGVTRRC